MKHSTNNAWAYGQQVCWLPLEHISPRPSVSAEQEGGTLEELAASIRLHGLAQPITVQRAPGGRYIIVSGNRRFMACRMAGMTHIDAVVLPGMGQEPAADSLLDGLLSGRMHYLEEASALHRLLEQGYSRDALARLLGCTAATVAQRARLTGLDGETAAILREHGMPECYARALFKLPDKKARVNIARQAARDHLCVRDVELLVTSAQARLPVPPVPGQRTIVLMRDHRLYLNAIRSIVAQMQEAGIHATAEERSLDGRVEITLRMPTRRRRAEKSAGF